MNGTHEAEPCGLLRRLVIMLYDGVVIVALWLLAGAIALPFIAADTMAGKHPVFTLYLVLVWFAYLAWCWQHGGMTLGMRAWRVRLGTDSGTVMDTWRSGGRFAASLVAALPLGAGFLWALTDPDRRTWHDRWSGTRLVRF